MIKNTHWKFKTSVKAFVYQAEQASGIKQAFVNWTRGIKGYKEQKDLSKQQGHRQSK